MTGTLHKTLIIRFSSVGDIVLSSLLVRALRRRFPGCQLDFCVKEEFAGLIRSNPNISRVIEFPKNGNFRDLKKLRATIIQHKYDLIIDIHDSLRSRYLCFGTSRIVRIKKRKFARFMLVRFKANSYGMLGGSPNVALRYLETVRAFGVEDDGQGLDLFFDENEKNRVADLILQSGFGQNDQFVGICPSAKHGNKMWLKDRFADAAAALGTKYPIALFGSGDERIRCEEIASLILAQNPQSEILNLAGRLSFTETAAMMDSCALVITNDSGLMHIAAARKRKVVAVFGPTVRELGFFPFGTESEVVENNELNCRPCTHIGLPSCPKGHFKCMKDISAQQVIAASNTLLHARSR